MFLRYLWLLVLPTLLVSCGSDPAPPPIRVRHGALPVTVRAPADNPTTPEKIALGRLLFFDPILSGSRDVACATCHHPSAGWAEFRDLSIGVNGHGLGSKREFRQPNTIPLVKRNAPTILNAAFNGMSPSGHYDPARSPMFWDNRARSLEAQALEPIRAFEEMRGEGVGEDDVLPEIVSRLAANEEYRALFAAAFPEEGLTAGNLARAIAAFERSLVTPNTRFDQYMRGDRAALSQAELEGFELFKKMDCSKCHNGPMFSDYKLHVLGVPDNAALPASDPGIVGDYAFRTPTLRNLRFTAPYMHNGTFPTLLKVLEFYEDLAMDKQRNPHVAPEAVDELARGSRLRVRDMRPIISFLNALNDEEFDRTVPAAVPSGLSVGGAIR